MLELLDCWESYCMWVWGLGGGIFSQFRGFLDGEDMEMVGHNGRKGKKERREGGVIDYGFLMNRN